MGRHTAPEGDTMHPVVAAALASRAAETAGAHRDDAMEQFATQRIRGNPGWPGEPPGPGGGVGWPGDLTRDATSGTDRSAYPRSDDAADDEAGDPEAPALEPVARRRVWRRLLGLAA